MSGGYRAALRAALIPSVVVVRLLDAAPAGADMTKIQCVQANTAAQDLRRDGHFSQAREQLQLCLDSTCPGLVRDDCTRRLDELEKAQPTIVFDVKDRAGNDVFAVTVTMDGKPWAASLEGKALQVDPGKHLFAFTVAGQRPTTRVLLIAEGEKARRERVVVETLAVASSPHVPGRAETGTPLGSSEDSAPHPAGGMRAQKVLGLVSAGLGVVGVGVGSVFGLMAFSAWSRAKTACGGNVSQCSDVPGGQSERSTSQGDATISTVAFIAGGVLLTAGAVLFFTTGSPESRTSTGLVLSPTVVPGQAGMVLNGAF